MSRISDKIAYTANAIDDIQAALEERGFDAVTPNIRLGIHEYRKPLYLFKL